MNTGNFQNMAAMRGPTPGGQQQAGQQRGGGQAQVQHIFKTLQQQQHPPGWQTTVTVHQRTQNVIQL